MLNSWLVIWLNCFSKRTPREISPGRGNSPKLIIIAALKQLFYIKGTATDGAKPLLCLRISERYTQFALVNAENNELLALAYYASPRVDTEGLSSMFIDHPELHGSHQKVAVAYDLPYSVLTPMQFYDAGESGRMITTLFGRQEGLALLSEKVNEWQLFNEYAVDREVHEWVKRKFPEAEFHHHYSIDLRLPSNFPDRFLVDVHAEEFSVVAIKANKLMVAQTYSYSSPADMLYYLLRICEQFNLSQRETGLCIAGLIEKDSALYRELHQYFLEISFRQPQWGMGENGEASYPPHFFTPLNDLARCVS